MSAAVPTTVPTQLAAGDTVTWRICLGDYSAADGWVLSYALISRTGSKILITTTASGSDHLVSISATTTAEWLSGEYDVHAYAARASERFKVWVGKIEILPNYATLDEGSDQRTMARKTLDAIEKAILNFTTAQETTASAGPITSWKVEGLEVERGGGQSPETYYKELIAQRDRYKAICMNEEALLARKSGRATGRRILTQFR